MHDQRNGSHRIFARPVNRARQVGHSPPRALWMFGHRLLNAVLTVSLLSGSTTAQLATPRTNLPVDPPMATRFGDAGAANIFADNDGQPVSRWLGSFLRHNAGISVAPEYYGELFTNARGGLSTNGATKYQGLIDLRMALDFEKMRLPLPGTFFLLAQNTQGRGLTEDFVGDAQVLSNIDSFRNIMRVSEYWWEFGLLADTVTVRLGKQDVNTEFLFMDSAEDFVHSSFGLSPAATLPTYPDPAMGAVILVQLNNSLQLKVGVWDAFAFGGSWGVSGNDTALLVSELEYTYALIDGTLPGTFSVAGGYLTDGNLAGEPLSASHGYSLQLEQLIYRESPHDEEDYQGLGIFGAYYPRFFGAEILTETIGDSFVGGLVYTGLIPQRDKDVIGAGVAWAELFQGGSNQETVVECFYQTRITPRLSVQPDLQYIATPSGIHRDALAVGVRLRVTL